MHPFPPKTLRRAVFFCSVVVVFLTTLSDLAAQPRKFYRYHKRHAAVVLQPFSLVTPSRVRLAYSSSHPLGRLKPIARDDDEEPAPLRRLDNGGPEPTVPGRHAVLRNGVAYAPANAPESVKSAIWAANQIRHKPYVWGGGHGSFNDYGYDCSGTVSYALHQGGLLGAPIASNDFLRYGDRGRGQWITVYARHGHTFAMIAGLRLDTTDFHYGGDVGPRWHPDSRDTRGFSPRHPMGL